MDTEKFINFCSIVHDNKYDYSKTKYIRSYLKVKIICHKHGVFTQLPDNHKRYGCLRCANELRKLQSVREIKEKFIRKHGSLYNYSLYTAPTKQKSKIQIICNKCRKVFLQSICNHIRGDGCPFCKLSKGELEIYNWLKSNNFSFETQKKFDKCKNMKTLPFDFYIKDKNTCIEYDGLQHYLGWLGNKNDLKRIKKCDKLKTKYCNDNNIKLIRIKYTDFKNIEMILKRELLTSKKKSVSLNKEPVSNSFIAGSVHIRRKL